jgi:hypothetical protein
LIQADGGVVDPHVEASDDAVPIATRKLRFENERADTAVLVSRQHGNVHKHPNFCLPLNKAPANRILANQNDPIFTPAIPVIVLLFANCVLHIQERRNLSIVDTRNTEFAEFALMAGSVESKKKVIVIPSSKTQRNVFHVIYPIKYIEFIEMRVPGKNSFLKLPFNFDPLKLEQDLDICLKFKWQQHYNKDDFSGDWSAIALRSASGNESDILSHPDAGFRDTQLLKACPYFREIISMFACETETIRLLRLAPGSIIKKHRDRGTGYKFGKFRVHIVLCTHQGVSFIVDGWEVPMKSGECWYADFDCFHSVANNSNRDRVHLAIDCVRNDWSDGLLAQVGYDFNLDKTQPDEETFNRVVAELERMDTDTSRDMILKLKSERFGTERS